MKNEIHIQTLPIKQLPNGDALNVRAYSIRGNTPGLHVHIQASVHGGEHQGNVVIHELMKYFSEQDFSGSVTFVPAANPQAMNVKLGSSTLGRFNPMTGHNWNRSFLNLTQLPQGRTGLDIAQFASAHRDTTMDDIRSTFKQEIAGALARCEQTVFSRGPEENGWLQHHLQRLAAPADIVLDLHTGPAACRYLFAPEYARESARMFQSDVTLLIPHVFAGAMDEACFMPWVTLHEALRTRGRDEPIHFESFTVELGGEERISFDEAQQDAARILNYLAHRGVVSGRFDGSSKLRYAGFLKDYRTYFSPYGGLVEFLVRPGRMVRKGETMAQFLLTDRMHGADSVIPYRAPRDMVLVTHFPSAAISQGAEIFYALEEFFEF